MNEILLNLLEESERIAILGHIKPDGDCVGSCLALYLYIRKNYPEKHVHVWLQEAQDRFSYLHGFREILHYPDPEWKADLAVALDASDHGRLGEFGIMFDRAPRTLNIDHHVTNPGYAEHTVCIPEASSACEVLFGLLKKEDLDERIAACLYTGIVTDTGVFKYQSTGRKTMETAGFLMSFGIPFGEIIDGAFYRKTWPQNQIMGYALTIAERELGGLLVSAVITEADKKRFGAAGKDLDGIVEQMRLTEGCECSVLLYETDMHEWKMSLRSLEAVDVSVIAAGYGGGGHVRAAGCTLPADRDPVKVLSEVKEKIRSQCEAYREMHRKDETAEC